MKKVAIVLILSVLLCTPVSAQLEAATDEMCNTALGGGSLELISEASVATIGNILPIKFAGTTVSTSSPYNDTFAPPEIPSVCGPCQTTVIPRWGFSMSYWEPFIIGEATAIPYCFPSFGTALNLTIGGGASSIGERPGNPADSTLRTYQTHVIPWPLFKMVGLLETTCLTAAVDFELFATEIYPTTNNDMWATYLNPESFLVANPFAQIACIADSIGAAAGLPLDFMFWCLGSWGSMYPISVSNVTSTSNTAAYATIARALYQMHKNTQLPVAVGPHMGMGACQQLNFPFMRKSLYGFVNYYPLTNYPYKVFLGRSSMIWEYGLETPAVNYGIYAVGIYRKVECCAL